MKSWRKAIVGSDATVSEAIAAIESGSIQVALVLDGQGRLVGIVTDGDIRRGLLRGIQLSGLAADVMNRSPVSVPATLSREERLHLMRQKSIRQLPLLDDSGKLIGVETFDELIETPHYPNPVLIMAGGLRRTARRADARAAQADAQCRRTATAGNHHPQRRAAGLQKHIHFGKLPGRNDRGSFRRRLRAQRQDRICSRGGTSGDRRRAGTAAATFRVARGRHQRRYPDHRQLRCPARLP